MNSALVVERAYNRQSTEGTALVESFYGFESFWAAAGHNLPFLQMKEPGSHNLRFSEEGLLTIHELCNSAFSPASIYRASWQMQTMRSLHRGSPDTATLAFTALSPSEVLWPSRLLLTNDTTVAPAVDPLDIGRQLTDMKQLQDGWADGMQPARQWGEGYGKAPSHAGLDWLTIQFARRYPPSLPRPYLYPTPEGGVDAEWSLGQFEVSLEIDLEAHSAEWHCLDLETDSACERELSLDAKDSWPWLAGELHSLETGRDEPRNPAVPSN